MSFYEQNDSGLSPSAYDLPLPSGDSAPDSNYRLRIDNFNLTTPKIEATVENVIKFRDELERAFGAMNIHDYLELPEYVPPDLNLTYPVINHTSQADNIPDLADEVVRKVEDLMIENANRLSREVLFYKTKNGWYPWEEGHYKRPMVCIDDIVQPMPDEMLYPEPRLVEPPKAEEAEEQAPDIEALGRSLNTAMFGGAALILGILKLGEAIFSEKEPPAKSKGIETESKKHLQDEVAAPFPYFDEKHLIHRELDFLAKKGILTAKAANTLKEGPDDYEAIERLRRNVLTLKQADVEIDRVTALNASERRKLYKRLNALEGEDVYFDDPSLYAMLTLTHGARFAKDFAQYREDTRQLLEEIAAKSQERARIYAELQKTSAEDETKVYRKLRDAMPLLDSQISALKAQFDKAWETFTLKHSFTEMVPNKAFREAQSALGDLWAARLKDPIVNAGLRVYAQKVVDTLPPSRQLTDKEREKFHAALIDLLEEVQKAAGMGGRIGDIEPFAENDPSNAYAQSNSIYFNANKLIENGKVRFAGIITDLFHETAHVIQNKMSSRELEKNFGLTKETADYYMKNDVSVSTYALQSTESHAFYMGTKAKDITTGWPD